MKKKLSAFSLGPVPIFLSFGALISCGSLRTVDFDALLNKMVGHDLHQVDAPRLLDRMVSSRREGSVLVNEYWIYPGGKCRWQLLVNEESGVVTGWRYPDESAKAGCHDMPMFRGE
jgi:hypothetical protein